MNVLALDLGTRTGWALSEGGRIESGVQDFAPKRGESPGMRYLAFRRWLTQVVMLQASSMGRERARVPLIVYELPHLRGGAAATVLAGLQTRVEEFCAEHGIEYASVHTATLKKFTTGSGRGDKNDMFVHAVRRRWIKPGSEPDYDEVDAVCLLHYALQELVPGASR
jgi:hypothetical protein